MKIELDYTASTKHAPSGFTAALNYAAAQLDALITNNITISIDVSWNNSVLGEGGGNYSDYSYSEVVAALKAEAQTSTQVDAAASLPAADPNGTGDLLLSAAQAEALGLASASDFSAADSTVTFGSDGTTLNFSTSNFAIAGEIDFVGVAEHELTHALGRVAWEDSTPQTIDDLYRFSSPGVYGAGADPAYFSIDNGVTNLAEYSTVSDPGDWDSSVANDSFDAFANAGTANTLSSADDTLLSVIGFDVACYAAGTRIALLRGGEVIEAAVEDLAIGDTALTREGGQAISFIGRRGYEGRFVAGNRAVLPVYIRAGALGAGRPWRELVVSPGHAVLIGNALVQAQDLVNGVNITQPDAVDRIAYYHIMLPRHATVLAEGVWAESYMDTGNDRNRFANAADFPAGVKTQKIYRPVLLCGTRLERIRQDILNRAPDALRGYVDSAEAFARRGVRMLRLTGWAQSQAIGQAETPVALDVFINGTRRCRTLANRYRPDLTTPHLAGSPHAHPSSGRHAFQVVLRAPQGDVEVRGVNGFVLPASNQESKQALLFCEQKRSKKNFDFLVGAPAGAPT